jgi:hypothetical protein
MSCLRIFRGMVSAKSRERWRCKVRRPHRYFTITLTLIALIIAAGRYNALAASDAQVALLRATLTDVEMSKLIGMIAARGLADGAMPDPRASEHMPSPLPGASVSESIVTLSNTGERVSKAMIWNEPLGSGFLELQETTAAAGQTTAEYWVLTSDRRRCVLSGDAAYGKDGRLLSSNFWRNDPQLRFAGSPQFPNDVFPSRTHPVHFCSRSMLRSLVLPAGSTWS